MKPLSAAKLEMQLGGRTVLHEFTGMFEPGKVTAILGPNGAGKSTLLTCLAGLAEPSKGVVRLGDVALADLPSRTRALRIGFLPQLHEIAWGVDVETLVGLGRLPHRGFGGLAVADKEAVRRALQAVDLAGFEGRVATSLSGGERARALLARVLAGEPGWVLADEPLAGLDIGHQLDSCALLRDIAAAGVGVLVTLHDLALAARIADRVLLLRDGRVAADGAPAEALTVATIRDVYGVDAWVGHDEHGMTIKLQGRARG